MNKTAGEGVELFKDILSKADQVPENVQWIVCPPSLYITFFLKLQEGQPGVKLGAQNCAATASGAFTGEISAEMLASVEATHCIVGHSERRSLFGETDVVVKQKVDLLLENGVTPIFCCGENLEEREAGKHFNVVKSQVHHALGHLSADAFGKLILAYEPVWAIGTGKTATPEQAQEIHAFIRSEVATVVGDRVAAKIQILYGGSCNASNASSLFAQEDIDGGLIGGASLKADDFLAIAQAL